MMDDLLDNAMNQSITAPNPLSGLWEGAWGPKGSPSDTLATALLRADLQEQRHTQQQLQQQQQQQAQQEQQEPQRRSAPGDRIYGLSNPLRSALRQRTFPEFIAMAGYGPGGDSSVSAAASAAAIPAPVTVSPSPHSASAYEKPPWMWNNSWTRASLGNAQAQADLAAAAEADCTSGPRQGAYPADPFRIAGGMFSAFADCASRDDGGAGALCYTRDGNFQVLATGGDQFSSMVGGQDLDISMEDDINWQDLEQAVSQIQQGENGSAAPGTVAWGPPLY